MDCREGDNKTFSRNKIRDFVTWFCSYIRNINKQGTLHSVFNIHVSVHR